MSQQAIKNEFGDKLLSSSLKQKQQQLQNDENNKKESFVQSSEQIKASILEKIEQNITNLTQSINRKSSQTNDLKADLSTLTKKVENRKNQENINLKIHESLKFQNPIKETVICSETIDIRQQEPSLQTNIQVQQSEQLQQNTITQNIAQVQSNNVSQKKQIEVSNNQKKNSITQKKPQSRTEPKNNSKRSNSYCSKNVFLPNNFIVIVEKGFSLFTYHFSEKFMQQQILVFLTPTDCLNLRSVNKELCKRANNILYLKSQREQLIIEKKILKSTYRTQITDLLENEIQDLRHIIDSFDDIVEKDYNEFMQMVIPPQNLLIVLHIFLHLFGNQTAGVTNLLENKVQWKKVIAECFVKGSMKRFLQKQFQGKANLSHLYELIPQNLYDSAREEINEHDTILMQLNLDRYPFQYKIFSFVEKILDLYELLCLKYPNVIKYINLMKQIKNDAQLRALSFIDDNFSTKGEII